MPSSSAPTIDPNTTRTLYRRSSTRSVWRSTPPERPSGGELSLHVLLGDGADDGDGARRVDQHPGEHPTHVVERDGGVARQMLVLGQHQVVVEHRAAQPAPRAADAL